MVTGRAGGLVKPQRKAAIATADLQKESCGQADAPTERYATASKRNIADEKE